MQNIFDTRDQSLLSLKVLNLANNEITIDGMAPLIGILNHLKLRTLNISKNFLEDDGLITLISNLSKSTAGECLEKIDVSACKICDKGFMHLLENVNGLP